jgi:aminoglycoside phosphotransferase (APT) family kinase protein
LAAKLYLSNGEIVFAKAVGSSLNKRSPEIHRREAKIAAAFPADRFGFPKLLWTYDDGDWVVLLFENVEGKTPTIPWRTDELGQVLSAISTFSESLTPSPIKTITASEQFRNSFRTWREIATSGSEASSLMEPLDPWSRRNIDRLAALEDGWEQGASGDTLVHSDIRADNILLTRDNRTIFVDWPWACLGAKWLDLLFFLPSVAMQRGPKPWEIFDSHPLGKKADPEDVTRVIAALAGLFLLLGKSPPEPALPNLREFQLGQGNEALEWLKVRTKWE